jgi:hypothetical protein
MNTHDPQNDPNGWHAVEEMRAYASFLLDKRKEQHADWPRGILRTWRWPPHVLGDVARYLYITSARPIPELAIAAAIAFVAAICRRRWKYRGIALDHHIVALRESHAAGIARGAIENLVRQLHGTPIEQFGVAAALAESTLEDYCNSPYPDAKSWIFDCAGLQPPLNENRVWPLPKPLHNYLSGLIKAAHERWWTTLHIGFTREAKKELPAVIAHCQRELAYTGHNLAVQALWAGGTEKVIRLAALVASANYHIDPIMDVRDLGWAFEMLIVTNIATTDLLELRARERSLKQLQ